MSVSLLTWLNDAAGRRRRHLQHAMSFSHSRCVTRVVQIIILCAGAVTSFAPAVSAAGGTTSVVHFDGMTVSIPAGWQHAQEPTAFVLTTPALSDGNVAKLWILSRRNMSGPLKQQVLDLANQLSSDAGWVLHNTAFNGDDKGATAQYLVQSADGRQQYLACGAARKGNRVVLYVYASTSMQAFNTDAGAANRIVQSLTTL